MAEKNDKLLEGLYKDIREISILRSCEALLDWDERTYMPRNGSEHRGNQMALLSGIAHEKFVSPRIGDLLDNLLSNGSLSKKRQS